MSSAGETKTAPQHNALQSASPQLMDEPETMQQSTADETGEKESVRRRKTTAFADGEVERADSPSRPARTSTERSRRSANRSNTAQSSIARVVTEIFTPEKKLGKDPTFFSSIWAIIKASWLNVLLVFIPVGWALHFVPSIDPTVTFVMNFIAIIPLAKLLGFATEEIAMRTNQTIGGLINATLGNLVELIVAIIALQKCELEVVQSSLLGSILSNILLVLGMCFFVGGLRFSELAFKSAAAQVNSSLLVIAVVAILLPSGFSATFSGSLDQATFQADVLSMSRAGAVILLVSYIAYLTFQLYTHSHFFDDSKQDVNFVDASKPTWGDHLIFRPSKSTGNTPAARRKREQDDIAAREAGLVEDEEEEEEQPSISKLVAILLLLAITALVAITAEFLVDAINGLTTEHNISQQWVGLILLPIVGNAAEHVTAVTVSAKDKLDLSMGVAVGSSIQIALFVLPLLIIIAWGEGKPLSLLFTPFESIVLFLSILIMNYTVADARANWLEGWLLMMVYLIIAVSFWYYPSAATTSSIILSTCQT